MSWRGLGYPRLTNAVVFEKRLLRAGCWIFPYIFAGRGTDMLRVCASGDKPGKHDWCPVVMEDHYADTDYGRSLVPAST